MKRSCVIGLAVVLAACGSSGDKGPVTDASDVLTPGDGAGAYLLERVVERFFSRRHVSSTASFSQTNTHRLANSLKRRQFSVSSW